MSSKRIALLNPLDLTIQLKIQNHCTGKNLRKHHFAAQTLVREQNCKNRMNLFEKKLSEQSDKMDAENKRLLKFLAEHKMLMSEMPKPELICNAFPISTIEALDAINKQITCKNFQTYVCVLKIFINGGLSKNLRKIFDTKLMLLFNLNGTHKKRRFKSYSNLYYAILGAIECCIISEKTAESLLSTAFQQENKRLFQTKYRRIQKYGSQWEMKDK